MGEYYRQRRQFRADHHRSDADLRAGQRLRRRAWAAWPEQIAAWQKITAGVHAENGHIAVQLWHTGRISHSSLQPAAPPR